MVSAGLRQGGEASARSGEASGKIVATSHGGIRVGPLVLALDVGTSSCRASLYDVRGERMQEMAAQVAYHPRVTGDGGAELDADALVAHVERAIDRVLARAAPGSAAISAVGVSAFWHSLVGVDANGAALTPLYLWMDGRSRDAAVALSRQLDERSVHARTGCVLHASYWPAKLRWLLDTQPGLFRDVRRWVSFGEYLTLRLLGANPMGVSMASGTGLLDQHTCEWDAEILAAVGLDPELLPPIAAPKEAIVGLGPAHAARWPVLRHAPWLPAVGDGACSNVGAGCMIRDRLALMIGTSGAMRAVWRADHFAIPWGAFCYRVDYDRLALGGALNDGGSLFTWMHDVLRLPAMADAEAAIAGMEPEAHGLTVLPLWGGERSPGWADDARGAIVGLRLHTSPLEILRAALEGVALRFARIDAILRQAVPEADELIATGGALLRSPAWMQIMADALGRPVSASRELEASSRGAALLALESLDELPDELDSLPPTVGEIFDPIPAHTERYRAAADRQTRLYQVLIRDSMNREGSK